MIGSSNDIETFFPSSSKFTLCWRFHLKVGCLKRPPPLYANFIISSSLRVNIEYQVVQKIQMVRVERIQFPRGNTLVNRVVYDEVAPGRAVLISDTPLYCLYRQVPTVPRKGRKPPKTLCQIFASVLEGFLFELWPCYL